MNNSKYNFEKSMSWIKLPLVLGMITMMMFLAPNIATAQFLACQTQVNVSLGADCTYEITPALLLKNQEFPAASYGVVITDATGTPIGNTLAQKGDYFFDVTYLPTGNRCSGAILAEDKIAPGITCPDDILPTNTIIAGGLDLTCLDVNAIYTPGQTSLEAGDVLVTGTPSVNENCGMYTVTYADVLSGGTCGHIITRTFTVVDMSGNASSCSQEIHFRPLNFTDLTTPSNIEIECSSLTSAATEPADLEGGFPQVNGVDVINDVCNIGFTYSDIVVENCGGTFKIIRTMTLLDWCTNTTEDFVQLIQVVDTTAPIVSCTANIGAVASPFDCNATIAIPTISYTDDCSDEFTVTIDVDGVAAGKAGDIVGLDGIGNHSIVYGVTDVCGNTSTCETIVTITDNSAPIAVCDQFTTATLDAQGVATICAETFDDGSHDNCDDVIIKVKRMDALPIVDFANCVDFNCADTGAELMVRLRVYEASSNPSFNESEIFGLNFNECMVEVTVVDNTPPAIICPQDKSLDCGSSNPVSEVSQDTLDTPVFYAGELIGYYAGAIDNCDDNTIVVTDEGELSDCGEGTIYRTWTVTTTTGLSASCVQKITFEKIADRAFMDGNITISRHIYSALDGDDDEIRFPLDVDLSCSEYDFADVSGNIELTGEPQIVGADDDCASLLHGYEDKILNDTDDACVKILRTWTVIDWCQYNEASNYAAGSWEYTQTIMIVDNEAPVLTIPADLTVATNDVCKAWLDFAPVTATDNCDSDVTITNSTNLPNLLDFSRDYFEGVYPITFTAVDDCGNVSTASFTITVVDGTRPTPVCLVSLSTVIMPASGSVSIWAAELDASSTDNCGSDDILDLRVNHILPGEGPMTTPPTDDVVTFTCPFVGEQLVQLFVIDESGNYDYCLTSVIIQDPNDACGDDTGTVPAPMAMIAGAIETEDQEEVEDVNITVSGANSSSLFTGNSGLYEFLNLPMNGNFDITPEKDMNYLNGVTTFDLVLISQHILGVNPLGSPYKIIAADANRSNTVTTLDLVKIQRLILNIDTDLAPNTSWRFVDADHNFVNAANPFASTFPELISLNNLATNETAADFVGVKIGDVNGSAIPNALLGATTRNLDGTLTLSADDAKVAAGETFTVDFKASDFASIYGFQYTLTFDTDLAEFTDVASGALSVNETNFGFSRLAEGVITTSWFDAKSVSVEDDAVLFSLTFTANGTAQLSEILDVNSQSTRAEAYGADASVLDVNLTFNQNGEVATGAFELYQNQPNPFKGETAISFNLPTASAATITVMDISGRVLVALNGEYAEGYNEIKLNSNDLEGTGVLYYQIDTPSNSASMKMILID